MVVFHHFQGGFVSPMRAALYARVSTHDQQTLAMQRDAMHEFATRRGWTIIATVEEIASGAKDRRPKRQALLKAARQRQLDVILVWKLDRWGRSLGGRICLADRGPRPHDARRTRLCRLPRGVCGV
jgi:DNA invertase Pin-like site-specific DNA recombinase